MLLHFKLWKFMFSMFQSYIYVIAFGFSVPDQIFPGARIRFFHPGSRVKKAPDPGSGSTAKNLSIFNPNILYYLCEIWSGMFITDPDFFPSPIQGPKVLVPGSATLFFMSRWWSRMDRYGTLQCWGSARFWISWIWIHCIIEKIVRKILDSFCFMTSLRHFTFKNYEKAPSKSK